MAGLQGKRVAGMLDRDVFQRSARFMPAAGSELAERGDMSLFARRAAELLGGSMGVGRDRRCVALGREAGEIALQHMRHHEAWRRRYRLFDRTDGIADE